MLLGFGKKYVHVLGDFRGQKVLKPENGPNLGCWFLQCSSGDGGGWWGYLEEWKGSTTVEPLVSFSVNTLGVIYGFAWELKDTASKG